MPFNLCGKHSTTVRKEDVLQKVKERIVKMPFDPRGQLARSRAGK